MRSFYSCIEKLLVMLEIELFVYIFDGAKCRDEHRRRLVANNAFYAVGILSDGSPQRPL